MNPTNVRLDATRRVTGGLRTLPSKKALVLLPPPKAAAAVEESGPCRVAFNSDVYMVQPTAPPFAPFYVEALWLLISSSSLSLQFLHYPNIKLRHIAATFLSFSFLT